MQWIALPHLFAENAPCGRCWTAVASPYWPDLAREWVHECGPLFIDKDQRKPPLISAGFASVPSDVPVGTMLLEMDFQLPRGKEVDGVAFSAGSGVPPTGRVMPQLLPDGLGPDDHLKVASVTPHPLARPPTVHPYCSRAIESQGVVNAMGPGLLVRRRTAVLELVTTLAQLCNKENDLIASLVHPWIRPVVKQRNVAFMRELTFVCRELDFVLMCDYVFGMPMMGWARHSPMLMQRVSEPPRAEKPSNAQIVEENAVALQPGIS